MSARDSSVSVMVSWLFFVGVGCIMFYSMRFLIIDYVTVHVLGNQLRIQDNISMVGVMNWAWDKYFIMITNK